MKIKPCPFCGEEEDLQIGKGTEDHDGTPIWIYCGTCGAQGPWIYSNSLSKSIKSYAEESGWNGRFTQ